MEDPNSPVSEINLLILGETGVGKSTWINGFQNYIQFDTLQEAESHDELLSLIPSQFTVTDENYQTVTISTGEDEVSPYLEGKKSFPFLIKLDSHNFTYDALNSTDVVLVKK